MYQNNLLARLGANRELFGRMFPYIPQPQEPAPVQQQPPQDPMHGNAGAMEKYGQEQPVLMDTMERTRQPQPTVYEGNTPNPPVSAAMNSPHAYDARTIAAPEMSQDEYNGRKTAVPDVTGISNPYERQLILAEDEFDNPVNKDKGWKGWLKEFAQNFAAGINNTNPNANLWEKLGAGLGGGGVGAADRTQNERRQAGMQIPIIRDRIANQQQRDYRTAQTANLYEDNRRQNEQYQRNEEWRTAKLNEGREERLSREQNTKMRTVKQMLDKIESYDPSDPRMSEITKALGEVGLPIAAKDAKKKVQLIQDADTGAWTVTLTDPVTGRQEVRPMVSGDGKQLSTTSSSKVMANAAGERQLIGNEHQEKLVRLRSEYAQKGQMLAAKLAEAKAEKDQTRRIALKQEAARLREEGIRLRAQLDQD